MKLFVLPFVVSGLLFSVPAAAQESGVDKRVERLEKEMRAVQRKVFPGGSSRFFEPDIAQETETANAPATTTSAVSDLITRVDALERSLANLTNQVERNGFRMKQIEDKLAAIETAPAPPAIDESGSSSTATTAPAAATPTPDPERVSAVAAIVMPDTGDAGEDSYIYGFRLWEAKYYPEAQAQLKKDSCRSSRPSSGQLCPESARPRLSG